MKPAIDVFECALWRDGHVVRLDYERPFREIKTGLQFRSTLRAGQCSNYRMAFVASDGALICYACARSNAREIIGAIRAFDSSGWRVVATTHEGEAEETEHCAHCYAVLWEIETEEPQP